MNYRTAITTAVSALIAISSYATASTAASISQHATGPAKIVKINAAGSSFIYPVMVQWATAYDQQHKVQVNYQPIGSGGGIKQLQAQVLDFAASDEPLSPQQLHQNHWRQFPAIMGALVPIVHLPQVAANQLTLNGKVLSDIYMGHIKNWDNPAIAKLNPAIKLPHQAIIAVHRADSSGTTYNFSYYLSQSNPEWKQHYGYSTNVNWQLAAKNQVEQLGAKGNAGVASQVQQIPGSIGYVEFAYANSNHLTTCNMINASGKKVSPNPASFSAAAKLAHWQASKDYDQLIANGKGAQVWPMTATTFILIPQKTSLAMRKELRSFFRFAFTQGQQAALQLNYMPIPKGPQAAFIQQI